MLVVPLSTLRKVLYTGLYNTIYAVGHYQYSLKVTIKLLNDFLRESYKVMVMVALLNLHSSLLTSLKRTSF